MSEEVHKMPINICNTACTVVCLGHSSVRCSARFYTPHKMHGGVIYSKFPCHILHPLAIFYTPWWIFFTVAIFMK